MVEYLFERTAMHFVIWIYKKVKLSQIGLPGTYTKEEVSVIVACVCVCVCVCLYSFTCWFLPAARHLRHTWEVRINDLLLWVFLGAAAKFLHLYLRIYLISPPKTKTPADRLLERKRYDIIFALEKTIYIDIGYKSAHYKNRQWRKDTKDKEATLI